MNIQCSGGSTSFAKEIRALKMINAMASHWKLTATSWEQSLKLIFLQLHEKLLKNSALTMLSMVIRHLKQIGKVKKLNNYWPLELTKKKTNKQSLVWRVVFFSCSVQQQLGISWTDSFVQCKVDFRWQPVSSSSVAGQRRSSKIPPKVNAPENDHGHCLVVCFPSDPPQFSESWWSYYIWVVCSTNWWDALKTAMPAVGIGQPQNGPKSSPWQCPVACCTTSASEVERLGQWNFDSSVGFTWPLANRLPLL